MENMDPASISYLKALASLVIVLCLMLGLAAAFRHFSGHKAPALQGLKRRLKVKEIKAIDHRHKMVLVQRDNMEHLILISGTNAPVIIENNIISASEEGSAAAQAKDGLSTDGHKGDATTTTTQDKKEVSS